MFFGFLGGVGSSCSRVGGKGNTGSHSQIHPDMLYAEYTFYWFLPYMQKID